jgi:hypothetical protein
MKIPIQIADRMGAGYHNREQIERAIADDLAFLAAHPVRQSSLRKQA